MSDSKFRKLKNPVKQIARAPIANCTTEMLGSRSYGTGIIASRCGQLYESCNEKYETGIHSFFIRTIYKNTSLKIGQKLRTNYQQAEAVLL